MHTSEVVPAKTRRNEEYDGTKDKIESLIAIYPKGDI
jgi:hypothetical protein